MMKSQAKLKNVFAVQDCERILASRRQNVDGKGAQDTVVIDASLLADVLTMAQRASAWGA